jgi:hypothetical protein
MAEGRFVSALTRVCAFELPGVPLDPPRKRIG